MTLGFQKEIGKKLYNDETWSILIHELHLNFIFPVTGSQSRDGPDGNIQRELIKQ